MVTEHASTDQTPAKNAQSGELRFLRESHIRSGMDFHRAYALRCSVSDGLIIVVGHRNDLGRPRLGLSVSKKVGPSVVRNRWKRLIREAFRISQRGLPDGVDLIVIPRLGVEPSLAAIVDSLPLLAGRVARKLDRTQ